MTVQPGEEPDGAGSRAAGEFSAWIEQLQLALRGERPSDVPCGTCTACCTSSQFVHIAPDETDALARIPAELLFPAPRMPRGHVLMGYDQRGHCPMLVDQQCTIYEHRPRTCRTYDCRVFPAAGLQSDDDQALIGRQAQLWQFDHPTDDDRRRHDAVRAAAAFVRDRAGELPSGAVPSSATQLAVMAVELHDHFVGQQPEIETISVVLTRRLQRRGQ